MDYWIGDSNLFPDLVTEWHSEEILRLPRCFIAWNPPSSLPESSVAVSKPVSYANKVVRFGSFNHLRKLSDKTLFVWSQILSEVPNSILVLKGGKTAHDETFRYLADRIQASGIDQNRISWLPRTQTAIDHLNQYSEIDIALDPFPNGGCTTTCEALWMGVPVITLSGSSYVSRMSTAVLKGASMDDWCASSLSDYVKVAKLKAQQLSFLRCNRHLWRQKLQSNQLGDSIGLFNELEKSFSEIMDL